MIEAGILLTALLFGGMVLYSFGFAAFVFSALPSDMARSAIRRAFPHFYIFVLAISAVAALFAAGFDKTSAFILAAVAATTIVARQIIMPAINAASDAGATARFKALHSLSVIVTLAHIAGAGIALIRLGAVS
jgi:hypothetical protein